MPFVDECRMRIVLAVNDRWRLREEPPP